MQIENFRCPISNDIFMDPVLCDDGYTYERECIEKWLAHHNSSPLTRKNISNKFISNLSMKSMIAELLEKHPELKNEQYKHKSININLFYNNKMKIIDAINKGYFSEILNYYQYDLLQLPIVFILKYCKDSTILKHLFDNSITLECVYNDEWRPHNCKPIHYICEYSTEEMIKYIIDKGVDLECENIYKHKPLDILKKHSTVQMVNYLISRK